MFFSFYLSGIHDDRHPQRCYIQPTGLWYPESLVPPPRPHHPPWNTVVLSVFERGQMNYYYYYCLDENVFPHLAQPQWPPVAPAHHQQFQFPPPPLQFVVPLVPLRAPPAAQAPAPAHQRQQNRPRRRTQHGGHHAPRAGRPVHAPPVRIFALPCMQISSVGLEY